MVDDFTGPTIAANRRPNPALDYVRLVDAEARAVRTFWRGMVIGAAAMALAMLGVIAVLLS